MQCSKMAIRSRYDVFEKSYGPHTVTFPHITVPSYYGRRPCYEYEEVIKIEANSTI